MPGKEAMAKNPNTLKLPVLAVRDSVQFPKVIQTLWIARDCSSAAIEAALQDSKKVIVLTQRQHAVEDPEPEDLFTIGTHSEILHVMPLPDGTMRAVIRGLERVKTNSLLRQENCFYAASTPLLEVTNGENLVALMRECLATFSSAVAQGLNVPPEVLEQAEHLTDPGDLADYFASHLPIPSLSKQELLETVNVADRLKAVYKFVAQEKHVLDLQSTVRQQVELEIDRSHREYILREQIRVLQKELTDKTPLTDEGQRYLDKIEQANLPETIAERTYEEVLRLERTPVSSPEHTVLRNYLDVVVDLPWNTQSTDNLDLQEAERLLHHSHAGLTDVKERILEHLAVRKLSQHRSGGVLCFTGPPGVGKTSIGKAIAQAMGRKFARIALGGVRDEAEIRGHRRTYIGALPGKIIECLRTCGTNNPVIMLDEIDKMSADFRGDPTHALLEALDPEQNNAFVDHFVDLPFDLSKVIFIATANWPELLPSPLRDRMEIIAFPSYSDNEKLEIFHQHLYPQALESHGITHSQLQISEEAAQQIIEIYTRESGVRDLRRVLETICRRSARKLAANPKLKIKVEPSNLEEILGKPKFYVTRKPTSNRHGAATGMVYSEQGGGIVTIEVNLSKPISEEPKLLLTGSLGDVMKESAYAALTYLKSSFDHGPHKIDFKKDIHLHVPEGAVPKDGPSAGIAILVALASAFTGIPVQADVALTGEITLRGEVLPVGGVREKVLGAWRAGIRHVVIPAFNQRDFEALPPEIRDNMTLTIAEHAGTAIHAALESPLKNQAIAENGKSHPKAAKRPPATPSKKAQAKRSQAQKTQAKNKS